MTARAAPRGRSTTGRFHGVFPSLPTVFMKDGTFDEEGQRSVVRYCVDEGAAGIACLLFAGEFYKLSENERKKVTESVVDEVDRMVPVIVGISHSGTLPSIDLGKHAWSIGADGVVVTPPYHANFVTESRLSLQRHYSELARSLDLPIMFQDFESKGGVHLDAAEVDRIARSWENVRYVKVEGENQLERIREIVRLTGDKLGVFGGMAGVHLLDEMQAGIQGSIPGAAMVGHLVKAFASQESGETDKAAKIMRLVMPYLDFFVSHFESFVSVEKEVLVFKGIIKNSAVREPAVPLLDGDKRELRRILTKIEKVGS